MSEAYLDKFDYLTKAKTLIAAGDPTSLRYACLELRHCMEAVTYEKLRAYASRLPPSLLNDFSKWQPPHLVRLLLELEGEADQEYSVYIRREGSTQPMQLFGEHRTFGTKWLTKNYNKLGSFLHAPRDIIPNRPRQQIDPQKLRQDLESIVEECERVVGSSLTSTLDPGGIVEYNCQLCKRKTVANKESAMRRGRVSCLYEGCEAEHLVSVREDQRLYLKLRGELFPCQACKHQILIPLKHLVPDHEFACDECGHRHKLVGQVWGYTDWVESSGEA
jgi:hypothetical protein